MGANNTPAADRIHIGFFGRRNAGKSSVVNAVTEQNLSIVSSVAGTTTDPVKKTMELLPIGPVVIIDTPGFDDTGSLGELRVRKTRQELNRVDQAVLVIDLTIGMTPADEEVLKLIRERKLPYVICRNKADLVPGTLKREVNSEKDGLSEAMLQSAIHKDESGQFYGDVTVSARDNHNIYFLKEIIGRLSRSAFETRGLLDSLVSPGDLFVLVIPIDSSAPKGRLILPQQMVLSEILTHHAQALCVQPQELERALREVGKENVHLVITDSQAFRQVASVVPEKVMLTSFSVLMARYKGFLEAAVPGVLAVESLRDGDTVLISEGCTHHRQCDDIGTYKIPTWLKKHTGRDIRIETTSGYDFPEDLTKYHMVIHCGGCMVNEREMRYRLRQAKDQGVPFTNYGIVIAYMNGILERALRPFPDLHRTLLH